MENKAQDQQTAVKLKWYEWVLCIWPVGMVGLGGILAAVLGSIASYRNIRMFVDTDISFKKKIFLSLLNGLGAILLWIISMVLLVRLFPEIVPK